MQWIILCVAAVAAGAVNSVAGGGTLLTFPALVAALESEVIANATSTVALFPGSFASVWGYRRELWETRQWIAMLLAPSVVGGWTGARLLTALPESVFETLVPWLILVAALLFAAQPVISRWIGLEETHRAPTRWTVVGLVFFQFLVAVYGGYFGAGIGILMLASLSLMGIGDIHRMNALKSLLAGCINAVAVCEFILQGKVAWQYGPMMALAAIVGGYYGARIARRLNRRLVRIVVVAIGLSLSAYYFWQQWQGAPSHELTPPPQAAS